MSLFVDTTSGSDVSSATADLFTISWDDGNLGQGADTTVAGSINAIASIPVAPVTYTPSVSTGQATATRLFELVNNNSSTGLNWGDPIVVTALFGGNDPYLGNNISGNGQTYVDTGVTPNVIHVVYDTSQDGGNGIALFDTSGNAIQSPNAVILYHELSHAFHNAVNSNPFPQTACPGNTSDEPAAEIDENVMRMELGLCLRDVCNHGGEPGWGKACGGSATPGGPPLVDGSAPPFNSGGGCCFVVTAVTGSPRAYEISHLRSIRDHLAARSIVVGDLIDAIYAEYFQFSPAVADEIAPDVDLRSAVRRFVVAPLFAWYEFANMRALGDCEPQNLEQARQAVFDACTRDASRVIVPLLNRLRRGAPLPATGPAGLLRFSSALERASHLPLVCWAMLDPLMSAWTCGANGGDLDLAVAEWLGDAPLGALPPPPPSAIDGEVRQLATLLDFSPAARRKLGVSLARAWPTATSALRRHGFIQGSEEMFPERASCQTHT